MADDLKRVGLVFKEDGAVDFKKTLQEVNIELNKNYNQFKLTQAQWDSSTKSTEKLRAEQEYLKNAYEIQNDKVNTLRMQLSDLENAENKNTAAIKKKRNELTAAEVKLEGYNKRIKEIENQLNNTGKKIEEFGTKVENTGKKIESAGKKLSAFSAATGAALVASAKSAIDFEDAFAGVEKTVDGTEEQLEDLKQGIRDMAKEIPSTTTEISAVAEAAGQLGIKTEDILSFTRVMIDLGNSTNLSAEEAASSLAKFANVTKMSAKDYDTLGSTIVALGNNFATTEADIVSMSTRLASTGELAGLSESQILSLATAMSSVGIEAEAGGSAMSKLLKKIQLAVELGGNDLKEFSSVAGMTSEHFKQAFEKDAVYALSAFIGGLNNTEKNGKSAIAILDDMGLTEVRLSNTILSLANASDLLNEAVELGNKSWEENTALTNEANKRYETLKSKITIAMNKLKDMAITLGNKLMPSIEKILDKFGKWIEKFENLSDEQVDMIVKIGLIVTAIGPLLTILGKVTSSIGGTIKSIGTFIQAIGVAKGTITSTSTAVNGLASVFSAVTSPVGLACAGIGVAIAGITIAIKAAEKETKNAFSNMGEGALKFINGLESAESYLSSFNSTLFASNEEQQELQQNMAEIQSGITQICKTASNERRDYTQDEIVQLDEYFSKLRELKNREIEIQQQIAGAITQQATTIAQTFQGSLEEYEEQSQKWIKTATEQKEATVRLIEDGSIEEIALLNQRYATEEARQSEAYQKEYANIMEQKQAKINVAIDEVAKVSEVYANGYTERLLQEDSFLKNIKQKNTEMEAEKERTAKKIEEINNGHYNILNGQGYERVQAERELQSKLYWIWNDIYKGMDESQEKQLGVWLAMQADAEMHGGKLSEETQNIVDSIIDSYDSMPKGTKEAMKNAMEPMLTEMENKEPSLFAKATSIATGIINRLKKAFDEHSPSKETRKIMKFAMQPMEEEMEEGKKELFKQANELGEGVVDRLNNIGGGINLNGVPNISNNHLNNIINYEKMADAFSKALTGCKFTLDEDGFARIVKDELYKVV